MTPEMPNLYPTEAVAPCPAHEELLGVLISCFLDKGHTGPHSGASGHTWENTSRLTKPTPAVESITKKIVPDPVEEARKVVAAHLVRSALQDDYGSWWCEYPDLTQEDFNLVLEQVELVIQDIEPKPETYTEAYALLAIKAVAEAQEEEEASE